MRLPSRWATLLSSLWLVQTAGVGTLSPPWWEGNLPPWAQERQRFMIGRLRDSQLVVYSGLDYTIDAIYPERCTPQGREFVASWAL